MWLLAFLATTRSSDCVGWLPRALVRRGSAAATERRWPCRQAARPKMPIPPRRDHTPPKMPISPHTT